MKNGEMHTVAGLGAILFSIAILAPAVYFADADADTTPPAMQMESIEASLAYKKPNAPKQPQKVKQAPNPEVKPDGVSRDETKKVEDKKEPKQDEKVDKATDPLEKFRRKQDDDTEIGKPDQSEGADDGSELGKGTISKGDPYFQRLWADLDWTVPELARTGGLQTIACLVFTAEGKITSTPFRSKGEDDIATLADAAIRDLKNKRNASPEEVPTHLLKRLTSKGICFNLTAK